MLIYCTTSHYVRISLPCSPLPILHILTCNPFLDSPSLSLSLPPSPYSYGSIYSPFRLSFILPPPPSLFPIPTAERKMHTRCPTSTRSLLLYGRSLYDGAQRHKGADLSYPALPTAGSGSQGRVVVEKRRVANAHLLFVEGGRGQASSLGLSPLFLPPFLGWITST